MIAQPLLLSALFFGLLPGCPGPCVGAACGGDYTRAQLNVYGGETLSASGWSFDAPDLLALGDASLGREWVLAAGADTLYVGMPDGDQVRRLALEDLATGAVQSAVVGTSAQAAVLVGAAAGSGFGSSLSVRVEADGTETVVVGAPLTTASATSGAFGAVYRWAGQAGGPVGELRAMDATQAISGIVVQGRLGSTVAACGDLDGDALSDMVTVAEWGDGGGLLRGDLYVALSSAGDLSASTVGSVAHLAGPSDGADYGAALWCDASLDSDTTADLIVTAPGALDADGRLATGAVEIRRGGRNLLLDPAVRLYGDVSGDRFGEAVAVGDLDGDGLLDLAIGAPGVNGGSTNDVAGAIAVWYARRVSATASLASTYPATGPDLWIRGDDPEGRLGTVLTIVDLDRDGVDDLIASAPGANPSATADAVQSGVVYVWRGVDGGWAAPPTPGGADATLAGKRQYLRAGSALAAPDLDGDRVPDLVVRTWQ